MLLFANVMGIGLKAAFFLWSTALLMIIMGTGSVKAGHTQGGAFRFLVELWVRDIRSFRAVGINCWYFVGMLLFAARTESNPYRSLLVFPGDAKRRTEKER
jgi:hypothetical protein